ncbi:MAG: hypothetical protein AAF654_07490 [Myxococcota bacterium]
MRVAPFLFAVLFIRSASAAPLETRLDAAISGCRNNFAFDAEDSPKQIRDIRNGYVSIDGDYPTCGCNCAAQAAAFKTAGGEYRILAYHTDDCSFRSELVGDDWAKVLPADLRPWFGLDLPAEDRPAFYLEPSIPRKGTDLELRLKPLPLKFDPECTGSICLQRSNSNAQVGYDDPHELDRRYAAYLRAKYTTVLLKWNRTRGRFELKSRTKAKHMSKQDFERSCMQWEALC